MLSVEPSLFLTGLLWNLSNDVQHIGLVGVTSTLWGSFVANHRMSVYKNCIGLLFHHVRTSYLSVSMMHEYGQYISLKMFPACIRAHCLTLVPPLIFTCYSHTKFKGAMRH